MPSISQAHRPGSDNAIEGSRLVRVWPQRRRESDHTDRLRVPFLITLATEFVNKNVSLYWQSSLSLSKAKTIDFRNGIFPRCPKNLVTIAADGLQARFSFLFVFAKRMPENSPRMIFLRFGIFRKSLNTYAVPHQQQMISFFLLVVSEQMLYLTFSSLYLPSTIKSALLPV